MSDDDKFAEECVDLFAKRIASGGGLSLLNLPLPTNLNIPFFRAAGAGAR